MHATARSSSRPRGPSRTADTVLVGGSLLLTVLLAPFDAWAVLFAVGVHVTVVRLVVAAFEPPQRVLR